MEILQPVSIILEAIIVIVAIAIAVRKKKCYGCGFALTFAIYVYYDSAKYFGWGALSAWLYPLFFVATVSALFSMISLYKKL